MSKVTFDNGEKSLSKKESIEWIRIWCEDTNDQNLPRVAMIGDSITEGCYNLVKEELKDIAKVDYLATSYSITSNMYKESVKNFVSDSKYAVVQFNYGLHAHYVDDESYEESCKELIKFIIPRVKSVILATTTVVLDKKLKNENKRWKDKILSRNEKLYKVAREYDLKVNDLHKFTKEMDVSLRSEDGVHFTSEGYKLLSKQVSEFLKDSF